MSYILDFATKHDTALLEKINAVNAATVGRKLVVADIEIVELSQLANGSYSVELINRADLTDTVTISHQKLDLADFLKYEVADLAWWDPANVDPDTDTALAQAMFNTALTKAGIIASVAWEPGVGVSIIHDAATSQYTLLFSPSSHVWKEYRYDLPRSFPAVFSKQVLDGFKEEVVA